MAGTQEGDIARRLTRAGLRDIVGGALMASADYADFEDFWEPLTHGVGPVGAHLRSLTDAQRSGVREALRARVPQGPFTLDARAWYARGTVGPVDILRGCRGERGRIQATPHRRRRFGRSTSRPPAGLCSRPPAPRSARRATRRRRSTRSRPRPASPRARCTTTSPARRRCSAPCTPRWRPRPRRARPEPETRRGRRSTRSWPG